MGKYNFDEIVDRYSAHSRKWCKYPNKDVIPLWIADMDFKAAPEIVESMHNVLDHQIYGYNDFQAVLTKNLILYMKRKFSWETEFEDYMFLPGMVAGINVACRALTEEGDSILTATPIYPPFMSAVKLANRKLVKLPLEVINGRYTWNFVKLEELLADKTINIKLILLCNPHNPVGRVWDKDELEALALLAKKYNVYICSDEIHYGLVLDKNKKHLPITSLNEDSKMRTLTLMAQSKTFNLAGLDCAYMISSNPEIRKKLAKITTGLFFSPNIFGLTATNTAITKCDKWHEELIDYLNGNLTEIINYVNTWQDISIIPQEATYLAWLDCRKFAEKRGIKNIHKWFEEHDVGLGNGTDFDANGFVRINFATQRAMLVKALQRMDDAIKIIKY